MTIQDYNTLNDMLKSFYSELNELDIQLQYNKRCIKEAEIYAKSFTDMEPESYRLFSPRSAEYIHEEKIQRTNLEKAEYENMCCSLEAERKILLERINGIEEVLLHEDYDLTVLNMQEEDRQRIARDLHDTSLQNLTHLIHKIELSTLYIDKDPMNAKLELSLVSKALRETIDEIRNTIFNLRPMTFDDLGLKVAFERLLENINSDNQFQITTHIEDVPCENNLVLVSIYRIVQESLNNIKKHAECTAIDFSCRMVSDICIIDIADNGKGFELDKIEGKHFGMSLMRERAELLKGKMQIDSHPGEGTKINIKIPLDKYKGRRL